MNTIKNISKFVAMIVTITTCCYGQGHHNTGIEFGLDANRYDTLGLIESSPEVTSMYAKSLAPTFAQADIAFSQAYELSESFAAQTPSSEAAQGAQLLANKRQCDAIDLKIDGYAGNIGQRYDPLVGVIVHDIPAAQYRFSTRLNNARRDETVLNGLAKQINGNIQGILSGTYEVNLAGADDSTAREVQSIQSEIHKATTLDQKKLAADKLLKVANGLYRTSQRIALEAQKSYQNGMGNLGRQYNAAISEVQGLNQAFADMLGLQKSKEFLKQEAGSIKMLQSNERVLMGRDDPVY